MSPSLESPALERVYIVSDPKTIKYDVHAHRVGLETKHHRRLSKEQADCLRIQYVGIGYRVSFTLNHDKDEDFFGEGDYVG